MHTDRTHVIYDIALGSFLEHLLFVCYYYYSTLFCAVGQFSAPFSLHADMFFEYPIFDVMNVVFYR